MTPGKLSKRIVADRISWIEQMLNEIRSLPLEDKDAFFSDKRNVWAAESCLRRALEALLDLGRHILAKGFGMGVTEYKEIAEYLREKGVLIPQEAQVLKMLAGYRNRLVHFYHEFSKEELYYICKDELGDVENLLRSLKSWITNKKNLIDDTL
jgi:uncharacterized protein YutE (UPF0331/DUF86 family)